MIIAMDLDDTYTADPEFWGEFAERAKYKGHRVYLVTLRHTRQGLEDEFEIFHDIYATGGTRKRLHLAEKGITPDIWIDDQPETV
jgi:hypothetical protein